MSYCVKHTGTLGLPTPEGSAENMPPGNFVKITPFEIDSEGPFCSCSL